MKLLSLLFICVLSLPLLAADDKVVRLTSLGWPPYSGQTLLDQGATVEVVRQALGAMGYQLEVDFYPWSRAVHLAADPKSRYHGYFPEYYSESVNYDFVYSDPIGYGPLGFAQRRGEDIRWESLTDLDRFTLGVVRGYVNTKELDGLIAQRTLRASEAQNDTSNLMKAAYGRIDLAVVDENVMRYLLKNDPDLAPVGGDLTFNPTPLDMKSLYVCFNRQHKGLADVLNQGLAKIDVRKIQRDYFGRVLGDNP